MFVPPRHYSRTKKGKCLSPVLNEVTAASKPAAKALHRRSPELSTLTVLSSSLNTLDSKAWLTIHILCALVPHRKALPLQSFALQKQSLLKALLLAQRLNTSGILLPYLHQPF